VATKKCALKTIIQPIIGKKGTGLEGQLLNEKHIEVPVPPPKKEKEKKENHFRIPQP
jgi:hypothetical protein